MADLSNPLLQECTTCGALIDVGEEEPFALMHCPTCGAAMRVRRQFGGFELQEILGAGGMGAVYRGLDLTLNRQVALKLLRKEYSSNPEFIRQFAHEAAITALVNHPNVVKVYTSGSDNGLFYLAMELVDKGSLDDLMTLQGRVGELQVLDVGIQIAHGLNAAFKRGLIHRDVKPGNILFADAQQAKIVDFGLAVPMEEAGTIGGEIWGTPYYVAPEKLDNKPEDFRSDIYSLGASLFHAVAGRPPYEAEDASVVALKHLKSQPVRLQTFAPDVSSETAYVINRTLHKDPDERYKSYEEFIEHLEYAKSELRKRTAKPAQKNRVVLESAGSQRAMSMVTVGMVAALLLGGISLFAFRDQLGWSASGSSSQAAENKHESATSSETSYQAARQLLMDAKYDEAAEAFARLAAQDNTPEPLRSWSRVHAGLAWTLAGKLDSAREIWRGLVDRGPFSAAPEDHKLADFFLTTATRAADENVIPAAVAADYSRSNYESVAVLAFAAKDWALGRYEEASPLFRAFHSALPEGGNSWVSEYKPIAGAYLNDYAAFNALSAQVKGANTPSEKAAALPLAKEALSKLKLKGPLTETAETLVASLEQQVTAFTEEETRKREAQASADAKALADARTKANPLAQQYRFSDARLALAGVAVSTEKGKREKEALVRKAEWLAQFKSQLIRDLSSLGYPAPIQKRSGVQIPGGVNRATDTQVEVKTPYGTLPVPWTEIGYESVFAIAKSFIRPDAPVERIVERQWLLGVYAFFAGKKTEGRALLVDAAKVRPALQEQLPLFLEFADAQ